MKEQGWNTVMIGKDTRVSGYMLESALQAGFIAAGVDVSLCGPRFNSKHRKHPTKHQRLIQNCVGVEHERYY